MRVCDNVKLSEVSEHWLGALSCEERPFAEHWLGALSCEEQPFFSFRRHICPSVLLKTFVILIFVILTDTNCDNFISSGSINIT
jgi:hypothetical protein